MSLFEWLCEDLNPGASGSVGRHVNNRQRTRGWALIGGMFALGICVIPFVLILNKTSPENSLKACLIILAVEVVYLLVSYFVSPRPDMSNIGWLGGMMDNPFRISDDINRFLLFARVALFPGRFVAIGLVDMFRAIGPQV